MMNNHKVRGHYKVEVYESGLLVATREINNLTPTAMINHWLDVIYGGATQVDPWYIGLINNTPTPALVVGDTLASHAGWSELTSYSGNRKEWVESAASGRSKTSSAAASFTMNANATIYGLFMASVDTGTSGILGSEAAFDSPLPVISTAVVNAIFTVEVE